MVQLYLEERWVEPPRLDRLPYSLLYHQTMSTLASCGEMSPRALADRVLRLHYFHRISQEDYKILLGHLIGTGQIQRTEQGGLIVGIAGERVVNSFRFYGVFQENEEYTVRSESQELGTVVLPPPVGEKLAIAGHVWQVLDVDHKRHLVYCQQVKGTVPAYFGQCPGDLHTKILEKMRQVLREKKQYPYLMKHGVARLEQARCTALHSGAAETPLIHLGGNMWCLLPWVGTYTFLAMERFLKIKCADRLGLRNFDSARPYFMQFTMKVDEDTFFRTLFEEIQKPMDPLELVYPKELPLFDKYDEYLPESLVRKGFAWGGAGCGRAAGEDPELGGCTDLQSSLIAYLQIHFHSRCNDVTFFHLRGYIDGREYLRALPERLAKGWFHGHMVISGPAAGWTAGDRGENWPHRSPGAETDGPGAGRGDPGGLPDDGASGRSPGL